MGMEVSMVATEVTMANVKLIPMPTPLARLPTDSLRPMPMLLAILTMSESSLELIMDMVMYLDMELSVTVAMLAMVVSMVVIIMASMASVKLTPMPTPQANAYATGHPHNVGVITGVDYGHGHVAGYGAIGNRGYAGYTGYGGYSGGYRGYYGKREADSDAYTIGQIAYGLPQANAYATGHPHNVGVITGVDYGHGHVAGYGAIGNRGYAGYAG